MGILGRNSLSKLALIGILLIAQWHLQTVRVAGDNWKDIIVSDGAGYYGYLPAIFIYKNFDYRIEQSADNIAPIKKVNPGGAIKYYYGEAVLLLPFFTIADLITQTIDLNMRTGYSFYYQLFVALAGIFYLFLGLIMLRYLLLRMRFSDGVTAFSLLMIFLASQLYQYALHVPAMSHVYSFAMVATLLNLYQLQLMKYNVKRWFLLACVASLIVLIRPVNAIFVFAFIPLSGSWAKSKEFIESFFYSGKYIILSCFLIGALFVFGQSYMYFLQTENWWVYSYGEEGFNWFDPHFFDVLFSYRKGLFVYAPILLFSLPGIWILAKRESLYWSGTWLILMIAFLYVTSSWWYWAYGGGFGMRPLIDAYPLFVIPLAAFLERSFMYLSSKLLVAIVSVTLALLQLFQTYQFNTNVLPYEYLNKEKYWHLFLKSGHHFKFVYSPDYDFRPQKRPGKLYFDKFTSPQDSIIEIFANYNVNVEWYEVIGDKWSNLLPEDTITDTLYAEISAEVNMDDVTTNAAVITSFQENWKAYYWERNFFVHQVKEKNVWTPISFVLALPQYRPNQSHFSIALNNPNPTKIKARKLRVRFFSE